MNQFELVTLESGLKTIRSMTHRQTFHPKIGPVAESFQLHVQQQKFRQRAKEKCPFVIWDVGFGAASNACAVIEELRDTPDQIELHSFDISLDSLRFGLQHLADLEYLRPHVSLLEMLVEKRTVHIRDGFWWFLHLGDFKVEMLSEKLLSPHSILYDPYSATENPELWTFDHFRALYQRLDPAQECLFTNYTRSTSVRLSLLQAGFFVGPGVAVGDKEESTLASVRQNDLPNLLGIEWLRKIKKSNREMHELGVHSKPIISSEDYQKILLHPQFKNLDFSNTPADLCFMPQVILRVSQGDDQVEVISAQIQDATYEYLLSHPQKEIRVSAYLDQDWDCIQKNYAELILKDFPNEAYEIASVIPGSRTRKNIILPGPMKKGEQITVILKSRI